MVFLQLFFVLFFVCFFFVLFLFLFFFAFVLFCFFQHWKWMWICKGIRIGLVPSSFNLYLNKAGNTATPIACGWTGAILEVPRPEINLYLSQPKFSDHSPIFQLSVATWFASAFFICCPSVETSSNSVTSST